MRFIGLLCLVLATTTASAADRSQQPAVLEDRTPPRPTAGPRVVAGASVLVGTTSPAGLGPADPTMATTRPAFDFATDRPEFIVMDGSSAPPQPSTTATPATRPSTATLSTDELLDLDPSNIRALSADRRASMLTSLDAAIAKWTAFGAKGGAGSGVLQRLRELRATLAGTSPEQTPEPTTEGSAPASDATTSSETTDTSSTTPTIPATAPVDDRPDGSTTADGTDDGDDVSKRDSFPPNCSFTAVVTASGSAHRRVLLRDIGFIDHKDPITNIASGANRVRFSNDGVTWHEYSPDAAHPTDILWTVGEPDENGMVTIYMQAGDNEGNWGNGSETTFLQRIKLRP